MRTVMRHRSKALAGAITILAASVCVSTAGDAMLDHTAPVASAIVSDTAWTPTGSMPPACEAREVIAPEPEMIVLLSGKVFAFCRDSAALYDPTTGTWSPTASLADTPEGPTVTLLATGRIL